MNVGVEVEQMRAAILVTLDQLPVTGTNHPAGETALVAVVRVVPEQIPALDRAIVQQQRGKADPVEMLRRLSRQPGEVEPRR